MQVGIITISLVAQEGSSLAVSNAYPPMKIRHQEPKPVDESEEFEYEYFYDEIEPKIEFPELYDEVSCLE